jgi:hypothetical protein
MRFLQLLSTSRHASDDNETLVYQVSHSEELALSDTRDYGGLGAKDR